MDEIEKALRAKIDEYIDGRFVDKEQLDLLLRAARGDATALDGLKNNLTNKRNEFEQKIRGAVDDAAQQAKAEAERQAQQAAQDALKGQTPTIQAPSIQTPSIPGLPGRR
jgi:Sec-independent protein translocase protein TatA